MRALKQELRTSFLNPLQHVREPEPKVLLREESPHHFSKVFRAGLLLKLCNTNLEDQDEVRRKVLSLQGRERPGKMDRKVFCISTISQVKS